MLFEQRFWAGIGDGSITFTFRRWKRPQVVAGRRYRTPGGIVEVDAVDIVEPGAITEREARAAGYPSAAALVTDLRGADDLACTRIAFHVIDELDPRAVLAAESDLDEAARAEIDRRLDRRDAASPSGPWTRATLRAIAERPSERAQVLAASFGRETQPFKADVRKLKALGLTISLGVGYRLSPRGEAYLRGRTGPAV